MACTCRGTDPGVVLRGGVGITVSGAGTQASPLVVDSTLAESLVLEVRDTATVNLTVTGIGTEDDPYVIAADTGSAVTMGQLGDVISDAPEAGAVPTWVPATATKVGHWEFIVPTLVTGGGGGGGGGGGTTIPSTWDATKLTGTIPSANLPSRLQVLAGVLSTGTNLNSVLDTGWYRGTGITNAPDTTQWWYFEVISSSSSNAIQLAYRMNGDDSYRRRLINGAWSGWQRVYSAMDLAAGYLDSRYPPLSGSNVVTDAMLPFASASGITTLAATTADNGGFSGQKAIAFPTGRFNASPAITFGVSTGASQNQHIGILPGSLTKNGFTVYYWRANSASPVEIHWHARDSRNS